MSAPTNASSTGMTDNGSSQSIALNDNVADPTTTLITTLAGIVLQRLEGYTKQLELDEDTKEAIARFDTYTSCDWDEQTYRRRFPHKDQAELSALEVASKSLSSSLYPSLTRAMEGPGNLLLQDLAKGLTANPPTADVKVELSPWGPNDVITRHVNLHNRYRFPFPLPTELANSMANAAAQTR